MRKFKRPLSGSANLPNLANLASLAVLGLVMGGFGALSFSANEAYAAEIKASSTLSAVTVFPRGAEITRMIDIDLAPGTHTIIVKDVPASLVRNSIRVEGAVNGKLEIGSVDTKPIYIDSENGQGGLQDAERKRLEEELQLLRDERAILADRVKTAQTQQNFITHLSNLPKAASQRGASGRALGGENNWRDIFELIGTQMRDVKAKIHDARIKQRVIDKKIRVLTRQLRTKPPRRDRRLEVKIHMSTDENITGQLALKYQMSRAGWRPFYDARLTTGKDAKETKMILLRRADIRQKTGEDWTNVRLALSTTEPGKGTAAPLLRPEQVRFRPKRQLIPMAPQQERAQDQSVQRLDRKQKRKYPANIPLGGVMSMSNAQAPQKQVAFMQSKLFEAPFQAVYLVPGTVTIKATEGAKNVQIGAVEVSPKLIAQAVPKLSRSAYLYSRFKLGGKTALLPGSVRLYRDGVFIGNGKIPLINPGVEHDLGFGSDDAIKINRVELAREKGASGLISSSKTDERTFKITVKNTHNWNMPVSVIDQLPFSEDEKIIITRLSKTTPPSRKDVSDRRGILAWDYTLKPNEEKQIILSYRISWPDGEEVVHRKR